MSTKAELFNGITYDDLMILSGMISFPAGDALLKHI